MPKQKHYSDAHDIDKQLFYMQKLTYFINRQKESLSK